MKTTDIDVNFLEGFLDHCAKARIPEEMIEPLYKQAVHFSYASDPDYREGFITEMTRNSRFTAEEAEAVLEKRAAGWSVAMTEKKAGPGTWLADALGLGARAVKGVGRPMLNHPVLSTALAGTAVGAPMLGQSMRHGALSGLNERLQTMMMSPDEVAEASNMMGGSESSAGIGHMLASLGGNTSHRWTRPGQVMNALSQGNASRAFGARRNMDRGMLSRMGQMQEAGGGGMGMMGMPYSPMMGMGAFPRLI